MGFPSLSAAEAAQLGTPGFPTRAEWAAIRPRLLPAPRPSSRACARR